jgi:hypothetical protein
MIKVKIVVYLFLARRAGWFIGAFARTQTRCLSRAQFNGWQPENAEVAARLAKRQFQLFCFRREKMELRKLREYPLRHK